MEESSKTDRERKPVTEVGADTQERFRNYQAPYTLKQALKTLNDSSGVINVYCELDDDVIIERNDKSAVAVQVSSQQAGRPALNSNSEKFLKSLKNFAILERRSSFKLVEFLVVSSVGFDSAASDHRKIEHLIEQCVSHLNGGSLPQSTINWVNKQVEELLKVPDLNTFNSQQLITLISKIKLENGAHLHTINTEVRDELRSVSQIDSERLSQSELDSIFNFLISQICDVACITLSSLETEISATEVDAEARRINELWQRKKFDRAKILSLIEGELKKVKQSRLSSAKPLIEPPSDSKPILIEVDKIKTELYQVRRSFNDSASTSSFGIGLRAGVLLREVTSDDSTVEESRHSGPDYNPIIDQIKGLIDKHDTAAAKDLLSRYESSILRDGSQRHKFRFHTNYGVALESEGNNSEAARHLIEALNFAPDDVKALCNAAYAAIISDDLSQAEKYSRRAIELESENPAGYATLIASTRAGKTLDELVSEVPEQLRVNPEIAYALGCYAKELNKIEQALEWFELAAKGEKPHSIKLSMQLGEVLLRVASKSREKAALGALDVNDSAMVERSLAMFDEVWNRVGKTPLARQYEVALVNIAYAARISRKKDQLSQCLVYIQEYSKSTTLSEQLLKTKALLEIDHENLPSALVTLEGIERPIDNEILYLKLELSNELNRIGVYHSTFKVLFRQDDPNVRNDALRIRINHALDRDRKREARKLLDCLSKEAPSDIHTHILESKYFRIIKKSSEAVISLNKAKEYLNVNSTLRHRLDYAVEAHFLGVPRDAVEALKPVVNPSQDGLLTKRYIEYLYRAGDIPRVREIATNLLSTTRDPVFYNSMLASIAEEVNDLKTAKMHFQACIDALPIGKSLRYQIQLCHLNYRFGNYDAVNEFLSSKIDSSQLEFLEASLLSRLNVAKGYYFNAIRTVYDLMRRNSHTEVMRLYAATFFNTPKDKADWLDVDKVGVDCAICISDESETKSWFIIEADERNLVDTSEIHISNVFSQQLLGRRKGASLSVQNDYFQGSIKIKEVISKYVYAYQRCLPAVAVRSINTSDPKKLLEELEKDASERREFCLQLESAYDACQISLERLTEASGVDFFDGWESFTQIRGRKILCSIGTDDEIATAVVKVKKAKTVVLDFTCLLSLNTFPRAISEKILSGKDVCVTQSVLDEIDNLIFVRSGHKACGYGIFSASDAGNQFFEISREKIASDRDNLISLRNWIRCISKSKPPALFIDMHRSKRLGIEKILGNTTAESIYLAKSENALLCVDDLFSSRYGEQLVHIESAFTEALLLSAFELKQIDEAELIECRMILARNQYFYVHIGHDVLLKAAEEDDWDAGRSFLNASALLDEPTTLDSAYSVVCSFLLTFFKEHRDFNKQMRICESLLDNATRSRDKMQILKALLSMTSQLPIQAFGRQLSIRQLLERWAISRLIVKPWEKMPR